MLTLKMIMMGSNMIKMKPKVIREGLKKIRPFYPHFVYGGSLKVLESAGGPVADVDNNLLL